MAKDGKFESFGERTDNNETVNETATPQRTTKPTEITGGKSVEEYMLEQKLAQAASRGAKKKFIRRAGSSDVFVADGKEKDIDRNAIPEELIALTAAKKNETPFPLRISKIRTDNEFGLCAICEYGKGFYRTDVIVPWEKFTDLTDAEVEKRTTKFRHLQRMQNAEIDVVIETLARKSDGTNYAIGNRRLAMAKKRRQYWFADEIGRGGVVYGYRFNEGSVIESRIIGVYAQAGIRLDILGCEVLVPISETSWARTHDLETLFAVGDTCMAKITKVTRNEETGDVKVEASIKQVTENPIISYARGVRENDFVSGRVEYIKVDVEKPDNSYILVGVEEGVQVFCKGFPSAKIQVGSQVQLYLRAPVTNNKTNMPMLFGLIHHVTKY